MGSRRVRFCLLAFLVIHASSAEKCKPSTCFSSNQNPTNNPKPGQQYTYDFESIAVAQLVNKESVETSVSIRGQAVVGVGDNCGYTLTLQNVIASGADNAKQQVKDFTAHSVQFTLSGDELSPEICADDKDSVFSLNVKRGIISAFQNGVGKSTELDIFGKCPVSSVSSTNGGVTTVSRNRDLNKCSYREKLVNGLMQGVATDASQIKTSPFLSGSVEAEAKFQDGVMQSTEINEIYNYLPFSTQEHGAKAKVNTKLTLKKTAAGPVAPPKTPVQRTLLYANANENLASQKVKDSIKSAFDKTLKEFTAQSGRLSSSSASAFAELVRLMRLAKRADLAVSYQTMKSGTLSPLQSSNKALSRSLFLDALFRAGTGDSVAALVDLSKKEFDEKEKQLMFLSFNLVTSVTKEAINELTKLFKDNLPKEAYLSIGSIINKYCRERGCEGTEVKPIADKFVAKIPKDCVTKNKKDEEHLVAVLKGIRNSHTILNSALNNIIACINSQRPSRVRVAALQAFHANPCQKKLQSGAISVMKNRDEDSEVRIEAYLAAMECPTGALANEVQALLDTETINQVGSFVNTHLDSIKASTDQKREHARHQFRNLRTSKKFPFDPRRYSFNREVSYAIDSLGAGAAVDGSVIYSQRSFLPRSVRMNVTGNLFGNSFNFLELSARQENLESVIERYFGPRGVFNKMTQQEFYDEFKKQFSSDRSKRALPQDMAAFDKAVKLSGEYNRDPDIDLSLKVFGTEMYFLSMSQNIPATPSDFIKFFTKELNKGVDALKDFNYNFENHALWLDTEVVYPTALGLPFKLSATGASAVTVDLSGSIDVKAIIKNPFDSKAEVNFSPAANIYYAATLGFNAYAFESGLEVSATVYTNTGAKTKVEVQGGKNFIVNTVPTLREQYVAEFTHQISTVSLESGREAVKVPLVFKGADQGSSICFDQVEFLFGAAYCFDIDIVSGKPGENALWPLYGSSKVGMKLEMADSITFRAELNMDNPEQPTINFYHDTPTDGKARQATLKLLSSIKPTHLFAGFAVSVPLLTGPFEIDAKVGFVNEEKEKKIYGHGNYQKSKYEYEIGFKKNNNEYVPILKLNTDVAYISGKIIEKKTPKGTSYQLQQIRFGKDNYQTTVDGSISIEGPKLISNLNFDVSGKKVAIESSVGYNPGQLETDLLMKSDHYPTANGKAKYNVKVGDKTLANDLLVVWDKDPNSKTNRVEWKQLADWKGENCKFTNELKVGMIEAGGKLNGEFGKKVVSVDAGLDYKKTNAELKVENKYSQKQPHDFETTFYAAANKKSIKIEMSRDIEGDSSKIKNKLELSTGLRIEFNGKVSHKINPRDADVSVQGLIVPGLKKEQTKLTYSLKNTQKSHDGNLKVVVGRNEVASLESKLTYGQETKGTMKGNVKDFVEVDATYEFKQGKGHHVANIALKDKKLHADTKFTIQKPTYDLSTDFYYDYEKDNTKKISFTTQNKIEDKSIDSKNSAEILSEKYGFNVAASVDGNLPFGKQKANVELQLPTGRKFLVNIDRDVQLKGGKGSGKAHLTATDELPNHQKRQLTVDTKINDMDIKQKFFDMVSTIKYNDYDNKDMKGQFALKNLAKGHFSTASGNMQIDGGYMPHTLTMRVNLDEYCSEHAIYSFNGKYGDIGDVDFSGKFYKANKDRPYSHEFTGTLNVPKTTIKKIIVTSNGQITEPANENDVYSAKYSGSLDYASNKVDVETEINMSKTKGTGSAKITLPNQKPVSGDFKFNCNHKDSADLQANFGYGEGKKFSTTFKAQKPDENSINVGATFQSNLDKYKDVSVNVEAKRPELNHIQSKINGKIDGQNFAVDYEHRAIPDRPLFSLVMTCPKGTVSKVHAEAEIASALKGKGKVLIEKFQNFDLDGKVDADLSKLETFYLRGDLNCPALKIDKYEFDIHAKDAGGRSGVEYKITREGGKHVLSGTSDFTTKTDKGRTIIEGKSTIKLSDGKSDDVTFKVIRSVYEKSRDGEAGFGGVVTVNVGPRNYAGELKLTDKEFHSKYSGCAKKNSCTNVETRSTLERSSLQDFKHNLVVSVDLRQIGFPHEFGLKSETNREGVKFTHSLDTYLQSKSGKPEYQYSVFVNPKEAGALLSTPKREIALDATYKYPPNFYGAYESSLVFYIDKRNKPQIKSEIGFKGEVKHAGNQMSGKADATFTHPRVHPLRVGGEFGVNVETMDVTSKLEFDVFAKPLDKIVITTKFGNDDTSGKGFNVTNDIEIFSQGLDFKVKMHEHAGFSFDRRIATYGSELTLPIKDFRFSAFAFAGEKNFEVVGVAFNEEFLKANAQYDMDKHDFNMEGVFKYLAADPFTSKAQIKGLTEGSFTVTKGNLLNVDGGFGVGKDMHLLVKGSGKEIFNGKVSLESANFMKTNYKVNEAEVKAFSEALKEQLKKDLDAAEADGKKKFENLKTYNLEKKDRIIAALPNYKAFNEDYVNEVAKLVKELKEDPNVKKFLEAATPYIEAVSKYFEVINAVVAEQTEVLAKLFKQLSEDITTGFNEKILPELKKLGEALQTLVKQLIEQGTKAATATFERAAKALKAFEEDFNKLAATFKDMSSGTFETITQLVKEIIQEVKDIYQQLREQLKAFPGLEYVKQKYAEYFGSFTPLQAFLAVLDELFNAVIDLVPENAKPLFTKINDYITKKLSGQEVNDLEIIKEIYTSFVDAMQAFKKEYLDALTATQTALPFSLEALKRLPPFITNIRFSALNQLASEPIVSLKDVLYLYRPYAFNPAEVFPPFTMHGEIADGSHIFTFDGRHLTFPGECNYVLARDFSEGNFSIIANMKNGKMKSIILQDKQGYIEVTESGLKYKDRDGEFPVHDKTIHAWRTYYTFSIVTQYGAGVECSTDLTICHVRVSGFYAGRTRGLMGNGNGEPYDDYLLPDGKITENTAEFGNAYKTQKSCADVSKSGDSHPKSHSNGFCSEFFGRDSSLRIGFIFVNPTNYREACEHATHGAANAQEEACKIARIYASRCRQEFIMVTIPKACSQCNVGGQKLDIGDDVSVKVPQKQADIVVVFDTGLEQQLSIVTEIIAEVRKELKQQGIQDLQVAAIGYNENDKYYSMYTTKGSLDFKGKFENAKGTGFPEDETVVTGNKELDDIIQDLEKSKKKTTEDLGYSPDARAFKKALEYPFRPTATKTIFAVRGNGIPYSLNPSKLATAKLSIEMTQNAGIAVHSLMPINIEEPADKAKNIVGFNNNVALLINEKKRPNMGSVDINNKLKYEADMGVDMTKQNGYVFNLKNAAAEKKKFVGIVGYVLADTIARSEVVSDCKCGFSGGIYPQTTCVAKERQLLAPKKAQARG